MALPLAVAAGCGAGSPPAAASIASASIPTIAQRTTTATSASPAYTVQMALPSLSWADHAAVAAAVNAAVQAWASAQQRAFATEAARDEANAAHMPASLPPSSLSIKYTVQLLTASVASFQFLVEPFYRGAANPAQTPAGLTFDLRTGAAYTLSGLFSSGAPYLGALASGAAKGLAGFSPAGAHCYVGSAPAATAASFPAWWLSPAGLVLSFPAGQYTAAYCGPPTVTLPYASLRGLAAPASPLGGTP